MTAGSGFRRKEGRDGGINREKWAGKQDLRTLLWTFKPHCTQRFDRCDVCKHVDIKRKGKLRREKVIGLKAISLLLLLLVNLENSCVCFCYIK